MLNDRAPISYLFRREFSLTGPRRADNVKPLVNAIPRDVLLRLIECGIRASSADNCQPWRFAPSGDGIHIVIERTDAFYDVDSLPSYFAIGGVVENIRIAAAHHGYAAEIARLPRGEAGDLAATVSLRPDTGAAPEALYRLVPERCTNRRPYSRRRPTAEVLRALEDVCAPEPGFRLALLTDGGEMRTVAGLVMKADRIRFEHEQTHHEFHAKLRFTRQEKEGAGDGLSIDTLELGPLGGPFLRFLRPWRRTARLNRWGLSRLLALHAYLLTRRAGATGLFAGPAPTPLAYLRGGELFHRLWLTATGLGLALQPMAALPLYLLRLERARGAGFEPRHLSLLAPMGRQLRELFGARPQEHPMMLFRLGYAPGPRARSARRPLSASLSGE